MPYELKSARYLARDALLQAVDKPCDLTGLDLDDVDWSNLRHYMTYSDTQQDLGFTKERVVYQVTV